MYIYDLDLEIKIYSFSAIHVYKRPHMAQHCLPLYQNVPYGQVKKLPRNFVLKIVSHFLQLCALVLCMYPIGVRSCACQILCALLQHECAVGSLFVTTQLFSGDLS